MKIRVLENTVVEGSVRWAGEVMELDRPTVIQLERQELVERVNEEDYEDRMDDRYPNLTPQPPSLKGKGEIKDIMVFTPVYRLEPETVEAVLALEWDGAITWVFQRDNPQEIIGDLARSGDARKAGILNHLHQYKRGRETFLQGRYDAMLIVESDMIPPRDALTRLAAVPADVIYGVYRFRASDVINIFELYPGTPRNIVESLSIHPHLLKRAVKLGVYPCSGAGFGCTLIRRRVLERLELRIDERNSAHCDTYFSTDVLRAGFRQAAEMRVVCGHKNTNGEVLWPRL